MKIIHNRGSDRVIDLILPHLVGGHQLGCVTPTFSLFAFAELRQALATLDRVQLLLPPRLDELEFLGGTGDRAARFGEKGNEMNEDRIVKAATGIRNTVVWKKLFKFQRDGVVGAIDKLARFGGCIIADSSWSV